MSVIRVDNRTIEFTNTQRILFPKDQISKAELITYYHRIAPIMLPHMQGRLISMQRFPDGISGEGFYQKDAPSYFPSWIKTKALPREDGKLVHYVICNTQATLLYLANQLCITPHLWLSKQDKLKYPDRMIFDLDPSGKDFSLVIRAAKQLRKILEARGLVPFVMTTGSRGLHVVVPIIRKRTFEFVKNYSYQIAQEMAQAYPQYYTIELRKNKRKGRVFIDYLRNGFGATAVAAYAVRARNGAPIAAPLEWSEVKRGLSPQRYTIKNIFRRLARRNDPWHDIEKYARAL